MNISSYDEVIKKILNTDYKTRIYFGKILNKVTLRRFPLQVLNPIVLYKLPSLYKFSIYSNSTVLDKLSKSIKQPKYTTSITDTIYIDGSDVLCRSIDYIYFPNKEYDVMIYQYIYVETNPKVVFTTLKKQVCTYKFDKYSLVCAKIQGQDIDKSLVYIDLFEKDSAFVSCLMNNLLEDVQYKLREEGE